MIGAAMGRIAMAAGAALLLAACAQAPGSGRPASPAQDRGSCRMADADEHWLRQALRNWRIVERTVLESGSRPLPQIVTYDAHCTYGIAAGARSPLCWTAAAHGGEVALPNGARIPPAPNAFNASAGGRIFVVMSLPSIWQAVGIRSEIALPTMLEAVMFHELTHAYQWSVTPSVSFVALQTRYGLPESVNDDSLQERFERDPAYRSLFEDERDLLFRAAAAAGEAEPRVLACAALAKLRERRRRYFTGPDESWGHVDEVSLTTEGLGQWVSYAWLIRGRGLAPASVLPRLRGTYWPQDEGLAIFLVVDRLVPGWQRLLFAPEPETAEPLLARACGR